MTANVFYLHSGITQLCAELVCAREQLRDIVVVSARGEWNLAGATTIEIPDSDPSARRPAESRRYQRSLYERLSAATNCQPFRLFVPHSYSMKFRLLRRHPGCVQLNYIEEGMAAYFRLEQVELLHHRLPARAVRAAALAVSFGMRGLSKQLAFDPEFDGTAYTLSDRGFPWTDRRIVLDYDAERDPMLPDHIVAVDWIDVRAPGSPDAEARRLRALVASLAGAGVDEVLLKFHPGNDETTARSVLEVIGDVGVRLVPAAQSFNLERSLKGRTVIGGLSSATLYGAVLGRSAYLFPWVPPVPELRADRVIREILVDNGVRTFADFAP